MRPDKEKGFMTFTRELPPDQPADERRLHWSEFSGHFDIESIRNQAYRCMNCGIPFCMTGCPLGNIIPDFNDLVKDGRWREALDCLHSTNNFPEFTGRVCPAPCESSCCLGVTDPPVTIKFIEKNIIERGWREGWITPQPPVRESGKAVAIVGGGPSGLAAAQQLRRAGHKVTLYERDEEPGGLLAFGIPDFKLGKSRIRRRVEQMTAEGVQFACGMQVGRDVTGDTLTSAYDAVVITAGSTAPRDLPIPGRELDGVHFAMEFLAQQNRRVAGKDITVHELTAKGKCVVVIGGGDTGSDCIGTSLRQGAKQVVSLELMPRPPDGYNPGTPWPLWPLIIRTSTSHEEGGVREWSVLTKKFTGSEGKVKQLHCVRLEWSEPDATGQRRFVEAPGSEFVLEADLVLLAMGFLHPEDNLIAQFGLERDARGNISAPYDGPRRFRSSREKVFAAGDARRGQSLVVWAIHEGREAARAVDLYLMGCSDLPSALSSAYEPGLPSPLASW